MRLDVCTKSMVSFVAKFTQQGCIYSQGLRSTKSLTGPIIRISPHELHVNDPRFIDQLYASRGKKRDRYSFYSKALG